MRSCSVCIPEPSAQPTPGTLLQIDRTKVGDFVPRGGTKSPSFGRRPVDAPAAECQAESRDWSSVLAVGAYIRRQMRRAHNARCATIAVCVLAPLFALVAIAGSATAAPVQYCAQVPIVGGIPPWGFHTGAPITGATGSYARGHGDINLAANTVSGILCQVDRVRHQPDRLIIMSVEHHLVYHSHLAVKWGVPGNIMKIVVRVQSSTDARCTLGTLGHVTLFASYNGVRSDSVQFTFPTACKDHDHLYHGSQVNNQVPPL
jgi:hypothetical protein